MKKRSTQFVQASEFEAGVRNGSETASEQSSREPADPAPESANVLPSEEPSLAAPTEPESPAPLALTVTPVPETAPLLEQRVHRLEEAVKEIRETRFTDRLPKEPPPPLAAPLLNLVVNPDVAVPAPVVVPPAPAPPTPLPPPAVMPPESKRSWLLTEMLAEARAIQFMFFDPRYHMWWGGRVFPPLLLFAFMTTGIWLPFDKVPGIGWLLQKAVELLLGFALFKLLGYEAQRYRSTAPDLPQWLRLNR